MTTTANIFADPTNDGPEIGTLVIILDRAKNLPNRKSTKQNPYCQARLGKYSSKTKTDRRGGQTPKWDEELRFVVHDSADYYSLKLTCFNDDKKTELIGDAWVDLKTLVVPGGGQKDIWQELKCQNKYAGEVRLELTYYDSRPKVEKPKRVSTRDTQWENEGSLAGPRQAANMKRRPLPSNPGSGSSTPIDQPRLQASGPRSFGTPPSLQSRTRRDTDSSTARHSTDSRRPLPSRHSLNPALEDDLDQYHGQQQFQQHQHPEVHEHDQYSNFDHDEHRSQTSFASGSYVSSSHHDRSMEQDLPPPLHHSYSAPAETGYEQHHDPPVLRRSVTEWQPEFDHSRHSYQDPFGPDHPQSVRQQFDHYPPSHHDDREEFNAHPQLEYPVIEPHQMDEDDYHDAPPPPPPAHRHITSFTNSLQGINTEAQHWTDPSHDERSQWNVSKPIQSIYGRGGHFASKSEVVLSTYRDPYVDSKHDFDVGARKSYNAENNAHSYDNRLSMRRSNSPQPLSRQSFGHLDYDQEQRFDQRRYSNFEYDERNDFYQEPVQSQNTITPLRTSMYRTSNETYPSPDTSLSHGGSAHSSPSGSNWLVGHTTPNRPHPLSQQHVISSSPPHVSPYQGIPIIKPLAISPTKSQFNTPASQASSPVSAHNQSKVIPRKSIPSLPAVGDRGSGFSTPFSPDSYDTLNPAVISQKKGPDPIVDFHGNVVDPSDRLPETSWAPEPVKKDQDSPSQLRSSPWAPGSDFNGSAGSKNVIKVRIRDRLNGSRELERKEQYSPISSPAARQNMYPSSPLGSSPAESSPNQRNRLTKKAPLRPQPVPAPSWNQPIRDIPQPPAINNEYGYMQSGPIIPAKIPVDPGLSSPNSGVYFTNDLPERKRIDPFSVNAGMQNMSLGNNSRRIGGRRLLGFGG